jgi:hypothetical protein
MLFTLALVGLGLIYAFIGYQLAYGGGNPTNGHGHGRYW